MSKKRKKSILSVGAGMMRRRPGLPIPIQPDGAAPVYAADSKPLRNDGVSALQIDFFSGGSVSIGFQAAAVLGTNWLIDKACRIPARDAIRNGYFLGDEHEELRKLDVLYRVSAVAEEMIYTGRMYGGSAVYFDIDSANPDEFYRNPFNLDGVAKGAYKGMKVVDVSWLQPQLDEENLNNPLSKMFYRPTFWHVHGRVIHHSHFHFFCPFPVVDLLKPSFNYFGVSLPQRIAERVYAAERCANEAPLLMMTKRLTSLQVSDSALSRPEELEANLAEWMRFRDNFGVKICGEDESITQIDTALGDTDDVIMTQYQLVSSAANIPATKLMQTQPKGFNATGEYEARSYREELESIQAHDLSPLLSKHYAIVARSTGNPVSGEIDIQWSPTDSPTAKEWAEIDKIKADRDALLYNTGAIDGEDIRNRVRNDRESDYFGIEAGQLENIKTETEGTDII